MKCRYCEKERSEVNIAVSIDNDFDYSCMVCNLEYINWKEGKDKHDPYYNPKCQKAVEVALKHDKNNNDYMWRLDLKTIAERAEIYYSNNQKGIEK